MEAEDISELYLIWKFGNTFVLRFEGYGKKYSRYPGFTSAKISIPDFLKGNASLNLSKNEAKAGNYTCEVTELSREGRQTVELKYKGKWHTLNMV